MNGARRIIKEAWLYGALQSLPKDGADRDGADRDGADRR